MIRHIGNMVSALWNMGKGWKISIGSNPYRAPCRTIILFPVHEATFHCGIAGLLTIKGKQTGASSAVIDGIHRCFEQIRTNTLKECSPRQIAVADYMGGAAVLKDMEGYVLALKQDSSLQYGIFTSTESEKLRELSQVLDRLIADEEDRIEGQACSFSTGELEGINNSLTLLKDTLWALERDVLSNGEKILYLSGQKDTEALSSETFSTYRNINLLINSLDRLEVRGRDSAGVQITFTLKDTTALMDAKESIAESGLSHRWQERLTPGDLMDGSISLSNEIEGMVPPTISFTYKKASVTGTLGENGGYLRDRIRADRILHAVIASGVESDMCFAHTRWASVGSITEENCHPINNFTLDTEIDESGDVPLPRKDYPRYGRGNWSITVALNGDIDNYSTLRKRIEKDSGDVIDRAVTTDTKIIALQIEGYLHAGHDLHEAFRLALNDFEGSHAVAMESNLEPDKVFLALRGSGQSLYVGICDNHYMFASELYGLVEVTPHFIKMDGEHERVSGDAGTKGQIYVLHRGRKAQAGGIEACYYDGHPLENPVSEIKRAEITTRDIDRKGYSHYLLKEILESPSSVRKTLRGKYHIPAGGGNVVFNLDESVLPPSLKKAIKKKVIRTIAVVGQGTAHVAAKAVATALARYLDGSGIVTLAQTASEFSGFSLRDDMRDTLIIPITQSGTTTDTNRAVALARERRASVIAVVNRRQSDITHIADGVFYTSDGRDIEMSVASTKAFYSQIIAGFVLVLHFAQILGTMSEGAIRGALNALEEVPEKMRAVLSTREGIRQSAWDIVKQKVYWAVVGSGPNKVAADEIRIKLSELCYKTISSDIVENKKHIDLSSEPLVLVCAAGNPEPVIEDIVKDVAIFKAHEAATVVITDEGERRFDDISDSVIHVPPSTFPTFIILNTLVGHIWGYYAACSIDEDGGFFRHFRKEISTREKQLEKQEASLFDKMTDEDMQRVIADFSSDFHRRRNRGFFSSMSVELTSDITLLLKYVAGKLPLEDFWEEFEGKRPSSSPLDMLDISLGHTIDELARPIDAIRHQAKTVTVGTSRKGEVPRGIIFDFLRDLDFSLENLTTKDGFTARRLQKALSAIEGYTLYAVDSDTGEIPLLSIAKRGGTSLSMTSRVEQPRPIKGTKKTILNKGDIYAGLGKSDGRPIVIIPLLGPHHGINFILLLHVSFSRDLTVTNKKEIMGDKINSISDLISEQDVTWRDDYLQELPIEFLLGEGDDVIATTIMESLQEDEGKTP